MAHYDNRIESIFEEIRQLQRSDYRSRAKKFVAEGFRFLRQSVESGASVDCVLYCPEVVQNAAKLTWIGGLAKRTIPCLRIDSAQYYRFSMAAEPDGILSIQHQRWQQLPKTVPDGIYLAVEEIGSPGNLGSIIRTCAAAGSSGIVLLDPRTDPYDPVCVRATMGALHKVSLIRSSLVALADWCKKQDAAMIATSPSSPTDYRDLVYPGRCVILIGGEKKGLSHAALDRCDSSVKIPMHSGVDSLNVAVATGLVLFEAATNARKDRQRLTPCGPTLTASAKRDASFASRRSCSK